MSELRKAAQAAPDAEVRAQHKEFARWFLELSDKSALASEYLAWLAWKAALAHPPRNEWREAVHDELVTTWTLSAENKDDPRKALQDIINWHVRVSLDPAVSSDAQALVERGKAMRDVTPPTEVTVLPDGSAFGVMSFPLPVDHWLYREREYLPGKDEPVDLPRPVLTHALREHVVAAVRYAVRGATNCGMELDFDPDALVLNAVYALCGPYCREDSCDTDSPISADGGLTWNSR